MCSECFTVRESVRCDQKFFAEKAGLMAQAAGWEMMKINELMENNTLAQVEDNIREGTCCLVLVDSQPIGKNANPS